MASNEITGRAVNNKRHDEARALDARQKLLVSSRRDRPRVVRRFLDLPTIQTLYRERLMLQQRWQLFFVR